MCGIAAFFAYGSSAPPVDRDELLAVRDRMLTRGPDGAGEWISADARVGFGHRRLTIIDLSDAGSQPMFTEDGAIGIVFNGEIYNYRELRRGLVARGIRFRSQCDTEVLLHLYAEKGEEMVRDLRGMFAFAIWDSRKRGLLLGRDAFGIKPLYYADDGQTLRLASQVKALLAGGQIDTAPEPAGHVGFFLWGSVPEPFTLFQGIRALPAGCTLWADEDGCRDPKPFFSVTDVFRESEAAARDEPGAGVLDPAALREALADTVAHHLIADVPVGVFLSAGLDSTTLGAYAREQLAQLRSVTLGFDEYRGSANDEVPLAERAGRAFGSDHRTIWVSRKDFEQQSAQLFEAMDQPSIDGVNTYFVSLAARRAGLKVALSGLGGDELFAGYSSFHDIPRVVNSLSAMTPFRALGRSLRAISAPVLKRFTSPKYAGLLEYGTSYGGAYLLRRGFFMPWELPEVLDPDLVRAGWRRLKPLLELEQTIEGLRSPRLKVSALELSRYMRNQLLRDSDWASMAHSLELRVPFVDTTLLCRLLPAIAHGCGPSKLDMARSAARRLPAELIERPKTGFSVPVRQWLLNADSQIAASVGGRMNLHERGLRGWAQYVYARYPGNEALSVLRRSGSTSAKGRGARAQTTRATQPRRILVYRIGQLGDTLVALPAMWAIRHAFPDAHIALLYDTHRRAGYVQSPALLAGSELFDQYLGYPFEGALGRKIASAARLLAIIRAERFDTLVYLAPTTRNHRSVGRDKLFFQASGLRHFIGMSGFAPLESKRPGVPLTSVSKESDLLLNRLAADVPAEFLTPSFELNLGWKEISLLQHWLETQDGAGDRVWLAVGPGTKMQAKKWPTERFDEVVARLIAEFDVWPVVFGGPEDRETGDTLLRSWKRGYNAAGELDIRTAALALKRAALYLGNDTGTMHLAAAVGVPCVAIFSSRERPGIWYPHGNRNIIFRTTIDCEGCGLVECIVRDIECLRRIGTREVFDACAELLRTAAADVAAPNPAEPLAVNA